MLYPPDQREGVARTPLTNGCSKGMLHHGPLTSGCSKGTLHHGPLTSQPAQYGVEMILDLYDCDPAVIRSARALRAYVDAMCRLLGMKKYGRTQTPYFGLQAPHTAGYSLLQFIETSSITGHFSELTNAAYLNVFSCKAFDAASAARFSRTFFGAKRMRTRLMRRV